MPLILKKIFLSFREYVSIADTVEKEHDRFFNRRADGPPPRRWSWSCR